MSVPLVSVIIATYNRANILSFCIETVLWQTFTDWELIIVGDACTDETAAVVGDYSARDPRIRFFNLEKNIGEQSGPNNFGCSQARGRYIAYLNHDDLWWPTHLETLVKAIEENGAALVHTMLTMARDEANVNPIHGVPPLKPGWPPRSVPASAWLLRRELIEEIGPWRFYRDCWNVPSQDWLFRAWKAGKKITFVPRLTVYAVCSAARPNAYRDRHRSYSEEIFESLRDPEACLKEQLAIHSSSTEEELYPFYQRDIWPEREPLSTYPRRWLHFLFYKQIRVLAALTGHDPVAWEMWVRFRGKRGGAIDELRRIRGLHKLS